MRVPSFARVPGALAWAPPLLAVAGILFAVYLRLSQTYPMNADGASIALEASRMLHGNWLLHGWMLADVTFYTTELPEYIAVEAVRGLGPQVVHIASALTYTLLVVLAAFLARGTARGRAGWGRALVAALIMLAPTSGVLAKAGAAPPMGTGMMLLLSQPDHLGTQVPLLALFLILDRAPGRWYLPPLTAVALAWIIAGDQVAVFDAAVPLAAVLLARVLWAAWRHGEPLTGHRYELGLVAAAGAGAVAGLLAPPLIRLLGGYRMESLSLAVASPSDLPYHLKVAGHGLLVLFGADVTGASSGIPAGLAWLHLAGVALAGAAFALALRGFVRSPDPLPAILASGMVVNVLIFVVSTVPLTVWDVREMSVVLPFGAVLAGRLLGEPLTRPRPAAALGLVFAGYAATLGYGAAQPRVPNNEVALARWLPAHHLRAGLATFNVANPLTVITGGRVRLLGVSWRPSSPSVPRWYQSTLDDYAPRTHYANFVVTNSAVDYRTGLIPGSEVTGTFGPPARVYRYRTFTVMVWRKNLLRDLGRPAATTTGTIG